MDNNIEITENKDGSKTILLDGILYFPVEKKEVTINRMKPVIKRLNEVGEATAESSAQLKTLMDSQKENAERLIKIALALGKLDTQYGNQ
tara:strand:+ start:10467 stop:10736 length:270 start_codon:yes stop_codon:yes gene_type:complete